MLQQYIDIVNENLALKKEYLEMKASSDGNENEPILNQLPWDDDSEEEPVRNFPGDYNNPFFTPEALQEHRMSFARAESSARMSQARAASSPEVLEARDQSMKTISTFGMLRSQIEAAKKVSDAEIRESERSFGGGAAEEEAAAEEYQMLLKRNAEVAAEQTIAEITDKVTRHKFIVARILRKTAEVIADLNPVKKDALQTFLDLVKKNDEDFNAFTILRK